MLEFIKILFYLLLAFLNSMLLSALIVIPVVLWLQISKPLAVLVLLLYAFIWYKNRDKDKLSNPLQSIADKQQKYTYNF